MKKYTISYKTVNTNDLRSCAWFTSALGSDLLGKITSSIAELGFVDPIVIDPSLNVILGHKRIEIAKEIDMMRLPCVVIEGVLCEAECFDRLQFEPVEEDYSAAPDAKKCPKCEHVLS